MTCWGNCCIKRRQKLSGIEVFVRGEVERKERTKLCGRLRAGRVGVEWVGEVGSVFGRGGIHLGRGFGKCPSWKRRLAKLVEDVGFGGRGGRGAVREKAKSEERRVMCHEGEVTRPGEGSSTGRARKRTDCL